jgi:uncharacterized C2H2 Zn-finger protein
MNAIISCDHCNAVFKTSSSLKNHLNKAKYCLVIQGKINKTEEEKIVYKCDDCDKVLSSKQALTNHSSICKEKKNKHLKDVVEKDKLIVKINTQLKSYKEQLLQKDNQIKSLQDELYKIANKAIDRPTTNNVTNTTTNNLSLTNYLDFDNIDKIKDLFENQLNINHIVDGQKGLAQFITNTLLRDSEGKLLYVCTDPSRYVYKYKNAAGEIKKDVEAKKLTDYIVCGGIKGKTVRIAKEWTHDSDGNIDLMKYGIMVNPQESILKIEEDNNSFKKELAAITTVN